MLCLKKLKTTSLYKSLVNNLFFVGLGVVLLLLTLDTWYFIIFLLPYTIYIYIRNKKIFIVLLIIMVIIIISFIIKKLIIYDKGLTSLKGTVISIVNKENYNRLLVRKGLTKVYIYDYEMLEIRIGDVVEVYGSNKEIESNHLPHLFNYQKYYYSQSIVSVIKADSISITKRFNLLYLRRWIYNYIDNNYNEVSSSFIKGMILGDTSRLGEDLKESIKINNISHLFAISGLHVGLLAVIIDKVLSFIIKDKKKKENIIIVIFIFYLIITNFAVSISRAVVMYILNIINERKKLMLRPLDILSFVFIMFICINPLYMYHLGFILSFFASLVIIIYSSTMNHLGKKINNFLEVIIITTLLQLSTFPIVINSSFSFNILSILTNGIFITIVSYVILPITILFLFLPFLSFIYSYLILAFNNLNLFFSKYISISVNLPYFNKIELMIYYLFIIAFISFFFVITKKKKIMFICSFLLFFIIYINKININLNGHIYFLDVYEGDATVLDLPLNRGVVMIDTGAESEDVISFLKAIGIRKIDFLILTHSHSDHVGNAKRIIDEFDVKNLCVGYSNNLYYGKQTTKLKAGDEINIFSYSFKVISPLVLTSDENDNSLILYSRIGNLKYLFLGDASTKIEEELISLDLDVDCVKVGHHGSKTSTSAFFYDSISPEMVFIETGRKKQFNFPNDSVIRYLSKYDIYRTDLDYTIDVSFNRYHTRIKKTKESH